MSSEIPGSIALYCNTVTKGQVCRQCRLTGEDIGFPVRTRPEAGRKGLISPDGDGKGLNFP
jgi:hypothetical protein